MFVYCLTCDCIFLFKIILEPFYYQKLLVEKETFINSFLLPQQTWGNKKIIPLLPNSFLWQFCACMPVLRGNRFE